MIRVLFISLLLWSFGLSAQTEPTFNISVDTDSVDFARPFKLYLELETSEKIDDLIWPEFEIDDPIGKNYLVWDKTIKQERQEANVEGKFTLIKQELTISGIHTGFVPFEPLTLELNGEKIESNALLIHIGSIEVDTAAAVKPIKPIYDIIPSNEETSWLKQNWWWILAIGLTLAVLLFFLFRKKSEPKPAPVYRPLPVSAYEKYTKQLQQVMQLEQWKTGQVKEHYIHVTDITRAFYEEKFGVSTFEKTNKELEDLTQSLPLNHNLKESLTDLFRTSEFVKFAKQSPTDQVILKHHKTVEDLLNEAKKGGLE